MIGGDLVPDALHLHMDPTRTADGVRIGGNAHQQLHQARGYGKPVGDSVIRLDPVEAAYLLYRDDIPPIDGSGFRSFVRTEAGEGFLTNFLVYKDLRERGFYLSPWRADGYTDFAVFERGTDPAAGRIAYDVRVLDERRSISLQTLDPGVLALVDEEGEVGYVEIEPYRPSGDASALEAGPLAADIIDTRVVVWDPPISVYSEHFFGQPVAGRETRDASALQLGLVEALYLGEAGVLDLSPETTRDRGQRIEGADRFDARATVYRQLRDDGVVPKTGFKFGADFRVYHDFPDIDRMGHSDALVRVLPEAETVTPAEIALDVRLAHGVGKRMVFALTNDSETTTTSWLSATRITP